MEHPNAKSLSVTMSKHYDAIQKKWIVRVRGITSGFTVHGGDGDDMTIEFGFDANRFEPRLQVSVGI